MGTGAEAGAKGTAMSDDLNLDGGNRHTIL